MKKYLLLIPFMFFISGCFGYASRGNEMTGQVKRVTHHTPIICPEWSEADISMGVMRNGVGSMSVVDMDLKVLNPADVKLLEDVSKSGKIVTVKYDTARLRVCCQEREITEVKYEDS